jgi:ketosteroid isomerase-like protein
VSTRFPTVPPRTVAAAAILLAGCSAGPHPTSSPAPQGTAPAAAAQELRQLQVEWGKALAARDTTFFQRTLADEFLLTGDATTESKAGFLAALVRSPGAPPSYPEQTVVRVFGEVAVMTGLLRYDIPGHPVPVFSRYTEVWLKREGRWQAVHGHFNTLSGATHPSP